MKLAVPKERSPGETRVALVPESVKKLVQLGLKVLVEKGAGEASCFQDKAYEEAKAILLGDPLELYQQADILVKVQKPARHDSLGKEEADLLREGAFLVSFLPPFSNLQLIKHLAERKITSFSMDAVPRITRAQKLDALSAMSTIAGYKAVLLAANASPRFFPMLTTAAGTVTPARVFIIGAGVAGLQAIATARRLGAVVEAFDTRPAVKEQVESLGARFAELDVKLEKSQAEDTSGYAKEMSQDFYQKEAEFLQKKIAESDVVITTAQIPGKPAPRLITEEMVKGMRPGSVIVDLAAEAGGNCVLTQPGNEITRYGVTILGTLNIPSLLPYHASQMYSRNITSFLTHLLRDGKPVLDWSDEILSAMCMTHQGKIKNTQVLEMIEGNIEVAR